MSEVVDEVTPSEPNNLRSPYELYEMALPHIIESNNRVNSLVSRQRKLQRLRHVKRLQRGLSLSVPLLSDEKLAAIEREGSAFERLERFKLEAFEDRFMKKMKDSVRTRVRLLKLKRKLEETFVPPSVDSKKTSSSGKKSGKKKQSTKAKAVKSEDASSRVEAEAEEEEVEIFEKFAGLPEAEALASLWKQISRKQIPKLSRALHQSRSARLFNCKKIAQATAGLVKRQNSRLAGKPVLAARRSMKEMLGFWKRNEREERELRKRAEKEAIERRRIEEEQREARRQAKKLNFLITQTELYSHFVGRRKQTTESSIDTANAALSKDTDFADVEDSVIQAEAERIAKNAAAAHHAKMEQFDQHRGEKEEDEDDMNFMNPSTLKDAVILEQPALMQVSLKSYQLKGLTWLASLYEQGINGILADEMGLGKTIQSISLLAHLAERSNNWGPYLIVTPASTLHNWQQEFARFVPALRIIPYWGSVQDRKVLRSTCMPFWTGKKQVTRDTPFHVMITSYQLIVSDEAFLQKVKWQYMILDEAQAIKSSNSIRWKTLLNFKCRNRLLLTGTPIQNSMQELWALLHFIMPTLFDSHDEFSEWFSKDIESHAENRGSGLNSHQLHRLHMILKPFMLRRVKADVENEMGEKVEKDVICELSPRQKRLYRGIKDKLPLLDLIAGGASAGGASGGNKYTFGFGIGSATNNTSATTNNSTTTNTSIISFSPSSNIDSALMNLVMQFRKVCNHPELLERTEILSPFSFTATGSITNSRDSSTTVFTNPPPIQLRLPKRIIQEVPLPNKRILLEVSNQLTHLGHQISRNLSFSPSANILIPNLPNQSLSCIDSFNFLQDRFSMAAPIKVISKGPVMFPSNDLEDGNASHGLNHQLATPLHKSIAIPSMEKFIRDCGKLTKLDEMLVDLKANGHRVLVYNQMTRMIDLLEEYLQYRGYSYLRLDGSTNISTRRDLVHSWQTDPSIFVFLLSTRAGGLGINLTAADTVIFYDSDWNPTVDQQAMDRAHRLGQLKQVTVYRMITRNTIEERIMQRAKQKDQIHKVVIAGGAFKDSIPEDAALIDGKPKDRKEIMSLLLVDED